MASRRIVLFGTGMVTRFVRYMIEHETDDGDAGVRVLDTSLGLVDQGGIVEAGDRGGQARLGRVEVVANRRFAH